MTTLYQPSHFKFIDFVHGLFDLTSHVNLCVFVKAGRLQLMFIETRVVQT